MRTVRVERRLEAPIEGVFAALADHANYDRFRSVRRSELTEEGDPPPNGVGAWRKVTVGPLNFEEEITAYEEPRRLEYVIREVNMPFEHEGGRIELERDGDGTHVVWTSTFRVPVPALGGAMAAAFAVVLGRGFRKVLEDAERLAGSG